MSRRVERLNSLLREVITEVIRADVRNPDVCLHTTISRVEITKDLHQAKVYVSILGSDKERETTLDALQRAAGFIGVCASKKIVIRFFPSLTFYLDDTVDKQMQMDALIEQVKKEREDRDE